MTLFKIYKFLKFLFYILNILGIWKIFVTICPYFASKAGNNVLIVGTLEKINNSLLSTSLNFVLGSKFVGAALPLTYPR